MPKKQAEVYAETHYWPAKRGEPRATLIVTVDELAKTLRKIAGPEVAATVLEDFAAKAADNEGSDDGDVREVEQVAAVIRTITRTKEKT